MLASSLFLLVTSVWVALGDPPRAVEIAWPFAFFLVAGAQLLERRRERQAQALERLSEHDIHANS
jgi:hypothetical protein